MHQSRNQDQTCNLLIVLLIVGIRKLNEGKHCDSVVSRCIENWECVCMCVCVCVCACVDLITSVCEEITAIENESPKHGAIG